MENIYCTLFDSNYLTRGMALYHSLVNTGEQFHLYIFPFDTYAKNYLQSQAFPFVTVVTLEEFEDEQLLRIKNTRTPTEYCWTCASWSILYVMNHFQAEAVTYLDADLFFFQRPSILLDEFHKSGKDVMITAHRYSPQYDQTQTAGVYNVQFMTFKNNENGRIVLQWWCNRCAEWCYAKLEDGKYGDQMYLDDWPERFQGIHVLQHLGGGVAPWNVQQYECENGPIVDGIPVVFYHFHALRWLEDDSFELAPGYRISPKVVERIYSPYMKTLKKNVLDIQSSYDQGFDRGFFKYEFNDEEMLSLPITDEQIDKMQEYPVLLVYGAGRIGREVIYRLQSKGIMNLSLVVSPNEVDGQFVMGKKKQSIERFIAEREQALVLLAVNSILQREIRPALMQLGFKNIVPMA